ncbi:hypothetical protein AB0B45_16650 [Nonomuraea sp. NPDC049152]|uniref:hypothetical protein n=1 Tax=Nonomuraea sp. NPDC049152 TaxID=3154350 RepID=UPI003411C56A
MTFPCRTASCPRPTPPAADSCAARPRAGVPGGKVQAAAEVLDRAVAHADEHVIKFTDTAAEVHTRTGHPDALAAALRAAGLIPPAPWSPSVP